MSNEVELPSADGVFFSGDFDGFTLTLASPRPGEVICGGCLRTALSQQLDAHPGQSRMLQASEAPDELDEELDDDESGYEALEQDGPDFGARMMVEYELDEGPYPASGQPGHECAAAAGSLPVWMVRQSGCTANAREHLLEGLDCECGIRTLCEVLDLLDEPQRRAPFAAHLDALDTLFDHSQAADRLSDGHDVEEFLGAACLDCFADPLEHASVLEEHLAEHLRELGVALRLFRCLVTVGERRGAHPGA